MTPHRLRAPANDGGLLAIPPLADGLSLLSKNEDRLANWSADFQGRTYDRLKHEARREVAAASRRFHERHGLPETSVATDGHWVVTGHQPELFHPGVWVKNAAVAVLARQAGGTGLNLIVDNDLPKSSAIRVPRLRDGRLSAVLVEYDRGAEELPFEDLRVRDERWFETFDERALDVLDGVVGEPLLKEFWPDAKAARATTDLVGLRFAIARRKQEGRWGWQNAEVPLSAVCETESFLWFVSSLLAQAGRFRDIHNVALEEYRRASHIRSTHHPVPALAKDGDWLESPFWVWRRESPRRRPLLVRQRDAATMEIRLAGEADPLLELPLGPDRDACCAVERLRGLPAMGVRLRSRALTTTMFARLFLGDLFLHGIGGAKYDELGDEVFRRFYGIEPPSFQTLSLTSHLGLPTTDATVAIRDRLRRKVRDLRYRPEQFVGPETGDESRVLADAKRVALELPQRTKPERRVRRELIRQLNIELSELVAAEREATAEALTATERGLRWNQVARSREYAAVLHDGTRLRQSLEAATELAARP